VVDHSVNEVLRAGGADLSVMRPFRMMEVEVTNYNTSWGLLTEACKGEGWGGGVVRRVVEVGEKYGASVVGDF